MNGDCWSHVCIVGLGGHARTKLIPAIAANGQRLVGIVTRSAIDRGDELLSTTPHFETVEQAIPELPADTLFVVASPPAAHFAHVMPLLAAGRDVLVEKPGFVTACEARDAIIAARAGNAVLVEGFMNRYTATYRHFLAQWQSQRASAMTFTFTIPSAPQGTFRTDTAIGASNLYDMGCYLLAAMNDAGLPLNLLQIDHLEHPGRPDLELVHLSSRAADVAVSALLGVSDSYVNRLGMSFPEMTVSYSPFIYGRPGLRTVTTVRDGLSQEVQINDVNAFESMLGIPRAQWLADQDARFAQILDIATHLERLGRALAGFRQRA